MKKFALFIVTIAFTFGMSSLIAQNYVGVQSCQTCHSGTLRTFPGFSSWQSTLHAKIHLAPSPSTMKGTYTDTVSMGSSYGNAKATFRIDGADYYVKLLPTTGSPVEYKIIYTYGGGWKQRYLVKIESSYYMMPVQWNLKGYLDNSTGNWASYNPQNWFSSTGALLGINNTLRTKSWDKNCAGCHVVPGNKENTVQKVVNGADTSWVYNWANTNSLENIVVGCESCHGYPTSIAGAGHVKKLTDFTYDRKLEVCAQCHFRGLSKNQTYEYPYDEVTGKTYPVGEDLINYVFLKPGLWPDGKTSKQHHQQWQDYKQAKHYNSTYGITCVSCHDPHQNTAYPHQLKQDFNSLTAGTGCVSCHPTKANQTGGVNDHSKHPQAISKCANCHMTHNAVTARSYDISNHSFNPIRPNATLNFSAATGGMLNTCAVSCHRNGQGTRGPGPNFGITDATLTTWNESTDLALADTLWRYYQILYGVSGIKVVDNNIPNNFSLGQNYPNPFNPTTTIAFSIPQRSIVKVEIYTMTGELVNIILNNDLDAGNYNLTWDAKSVDGYDVTSGVYIYRMIANQTVVMSKKMMLVR